MNGSLRIILYHLTEPLAATNSLVDRAQKRLTFGGGNS